MDESTKVELMRLTQRIASKTGQAVALNGFALNLYAVGETDKAKEKANLADLATKEAEVLYGKYSTYLDTL